MNPKHHNERLLPPLLGFNDDNAMDHTMKTMKNRGYLTIGNETWTVENEILEHGSCRHKVLGFKNKPTGMQ